MTKEKAKRKESDLEDKIFVRGPIFRSNCVHCYVRIVECIQVGQLWFMFRLVDSEYQNLVCSSVNLVTIKLFW